MDPSRALLSPRLSRFPSLPLSIWRWRLLSFPYSKKERPPLVSSSCLAGDGASIGRLRRAFNGWSRYPPGGGPSSLRRLSSSSFPPPPVIWRPPSVEKSPPFAERKEEGGGGGEPGPHVSRWWTIHLSRWRREGEKGDLRPKNKGPRGIAEEDRPVAHPAALLKVRQIV